MPRATVPSNLGARVQQLGRAGTRRDPARAPGPPVRQASGASRRRHAGARDPAHARHARAPQGASARDPAAGRGQGGPTAAHRGVRGKADSRARDDRPGDRRTRRRSPPATTNPSSPAARIRCSSTTTAAASSTATSILTTTCAGSSAATPGRTCSPSTTACRPSIRFPPRSKTRAPRSAGPTRTPSGSAPIQAASASAATAPAATWPRWCPSSRRDDGGPAPVLQLLIYPVTDFTDPPPFARAVRRRVPPHQRGDGLVRGQLPWARQPPGERPPGVAAARDRPLGAPAGVRRDRSVRPLARRG